MITFLVAFWVPFVLLALLVPSRNWAYGGAVVFSFGPLAALSADWVLCASLNGTVSRTFAEITMALAAAGSCHLTWLLITERRHSANAR